MINGTPSTEERLSGISSGPRWGEPRRRAVCKWVSIVSGLMCVSGCVPVNPQETTLDLSDFQLFQYRWVPKFVAAPPRILFVSIVQRDDAYDLQLWLSPQNDEERANCLHTPPNAWGCVLLIERPLSPDEVQHMLDLFSAVRIAYNPLSIPVMDVAPDEYRWDDLFSYGVPTIWAGKQLNEQDEAAIIAFIYSLVPADI